MELLVLIKTYNLRDLKGGSLRSVKVEIRLKKGTVIEYESEKNLCRSVGADTSEIFRHF